MVAAAILNFIYRSHFTTRLLLHIFARSLASVLRLRSYIHAYQNIKQK